MSDVSHEGHCNRLRSQVELSGLDSLPPHNVLEFLLFHTIPRRDVNEIAHRLIDRFGSLSGVLDARVSDLIREPGISYNTAVFLTSLPGLFRAYQAEKSKHTAAMLSRTNESGEYLRPLFIGKSIEIVVLVCMDTKFKALSTCTIAQGSVGKVPLPIRAIAQTALSVGATHIAIAHNHPGGYAVPSAEDVAATIKLARLLVPLEIHLHDHLVFCEDDFVSMRDSHLLSPDILDV